MITAFYTSILAFWLIILSLRVIALRGNPLFAVLAFRNHGKETLDRAVRAQGNLTEYAPMMMVMMGLGEMMGLSAGFLHFWAGIFIAGRLAHGICFGFMRRSLPLRVGGMVLTLTALAGLAIQLFLATMPYMG